jgi:glycine/D-amino acid oxidase-like deaminating enzyme
MRVLICGGGVIGASIAYFLSCRDVEVTVIERAGLACAASGKSGGFLALDWCDGSPLGPLARRSFALHAQLADKLDGDWGYRRMTTFSGELTDRTKLHHRLGTTDSTAQVHPGAFTAAMMGAAQARGAGLRIGEVTGLLQESGQVRGAAVDGAPLAADAVVIAMGPWSILASQWLRLPGVYGLKGHSLVFDTPDAKAEALFLEYQEANGATHSPEVFPRTDGTTYVCAISSESPLPVDPKAVAPDEGAIERLHDICCRISPVLANAQVLAAQACFRPVTQDGLPLIGPVAGLAGAYVATGHSVWGILNAPATGEAMAELIADGAARTVDLSPFRPERLRAFDPARLSRTR